jgi:hypothetical protein
MKLTFTNRRRVEAIQFGDEPALKRRWFGDRVFDDLEISQLREIAENSMSNLEAFLNGDGAYFGSLDDFSYCPMEWWDIVDENGTRCLHLWVYWGDAGVIYRGESAEVLGTFVQGYWEPDGAWESDRELDEKTLEALIDAKSRVDETPGHMVRTLRF